MGVINTPAILILRTVSEGKCVKSHTLTVHPVPLWGSTPLTRPSSRAGSCPVASHLAPGPFPPRSSSYRSGLGSRHALLAAGRLGPGPHAYVPVAGWGSKSAALVPEPPGGSAETPNGCMVVPFSCVPHPALWSCPKVHRHGSGPRLDFAPCRSAVCHQQGQGRVCLVLTLSGLDISLPALLYFHGTKPKVLKE